MAEVTRNGRCAPAAAVAVVYVPLILFFIGHPGEVMKKLYT
jgi:hypothetical protein